VVRRRRQRRSGDYGVDARVKHRKQAERLDSHDCDGENNVHQGESRALREHCNGREKYR
jgi:hypothetical protein